MQWDKQLFGMADVSRPDGRMGAGGTGGGRGRHQATLEARSTSACRAGFLSRFHGQVHVRRLAYRLLVAQGPGQHPGPDIQRGPYLRVRHVLVRRSHHLVLSPGQAAPPSTPIFLCGGWQTLGSIRLIW